jgi:hypothetical protein
MNEPQPIGVMLVGSLSVLSFTVAGILGYLQFQKAEKKRIAYSEKYEPTNPDEIVPKDAADVEIDEEKLKMIILEGDKFLQSEMMKTKIEQKKRLLEQASIQNQNQ